MSQPQVVLRRLSQPDLSLVRCRALLSEAERAEMGRFRRARDCDLYALARATLRECAAARLGVEPAQVRILRDRLGKPALVGSPGLACNVSHSGDVVAVALGECREIGVDVEAHRAGLDYGALAGSFMTAREQAALAQAPAPRRVQVFFRQWCFKEALAKALGTGLTRDPKRFEIQFDPGAPRPVFVGAGEDDLGDGWRLAPIEAGPGYSGALVWR